jgi:fructose-bisphosphate aldolase class II
MLVKMSALLKEAYDKHVGVGAFNTPNLEAVRATVAAAEARGEGVILQHAQLHESLMPMDVIAPVMLDAAKRASVPVAVHLDHGEDLDYLKQALELGFTSIMIDASAKPYEDNVAITKAAVEMAKAYDADVEAELGRVIRPASGGGTDDPDNLPPDAAYTDPAAAKAFVDATGVDCLAIAFGTAHGVYTSKPVLDVNRVAEVREAVQLPLVMHGGSGVTDDEMQKAIANGICKINYFTYMSLAGGAGVRALIDGADDPAGLRFDQMAQAAQDAMQADVERAMAVFSRG